jgi:Leucine-rich repeat (LRR) protein
MDREINLDSIRALEKQIQEHERTIIQLKRARNSLLNVSTLLPPEVLGNIFRWNVIPDEDFGGLSAASYNFLLVCHHWFQVASGTPGLWCFWGNSIQDWACRHARHRTSPLDLVLGQYTKRRDLDDTLRDALQDRAMRDSIRRVYLSGPEGPLNSVISSIITKGEGTRSINVESFVIRNLASRVWTPPTSSPGIISQSYNASTSTDSASRRGTCWDHGPHLSPPFHSPFSPSLLPTLSQMLSILSANPNLQSLQLSDNSFSDIEDDGSSSRIQLRHLKSLHLGSNLRRASGLLNQLELPMKMDDLNLSLYGCSPSDLPPTLGPYLGNHIRRRSPDRLSLSVKPKFQGFSIRVGDVHKFTPVDWVLSVTPGEGEAEKICFDIITHFPLEEVGSISTTFPILHSEELCVRMRNLTYLHLDRVDLSTLFVESDTREPHVFKDLLPGLRSIVITEPRLSGGDWSPLISFLTRRAAIGNCISSLWFDRYPHMDEGVVEDIMRVVEVFENLVTEDESDDER